MQWIAAISICTWALPCRRRRIEIRSFFFSRCKRFELKRQTRTPTIATGRTRIDAVAPNTVDKSLMSSLDKSEQFCDKSVLYASCQDCSRVSPTYSHTADADETKPFRFVGVCGVGRVLCNLNPFHTADATRQLALKTEDVQFPIFQSWLVSNFEILFFVVGKVCRTARRDETKPFRRRRRCGAGIILLHMSVKCGPN